MPMSLKVQLKKFVHKGQITQEEYNALINKIDGHDREMKAKIIDEFAHELKETFNGEFPLCFYSSTQYFSLDVVRNLVDVMAKQQKEER